MSATTELYGRRGQPSIRLLALTALYTLDGVANGRAHMSNKINDDFGFIPPSSTFSTTMKMLEEEGITQEIWDIGKVVEVRLIKLTDEELRAIRKVLVGRFTPIVLPEPSGHAFAGTQGHRCQEDGQAAGVRGQNSARDTWQQRSTAR